MRPHPRIRKTIKWGGAAVTVLLVVVWIVSGWCPVKYNRGLWDAELIGGRFSVVHHETQPPRYDGWYLGRAECGNPGWMWWFSSNRNVGFTSVHIPVWALATATLISSAAALRLDTLARRRERAHLCPKCGYDRTGIFQDAKCPECGSGRTPA